MFATSHCQDTPPPGRIETDPQILAQPPDPFTSPGPTRLLRTAVPILTRNQNCPEPNLNTKVRLFFIFSHSGGSIRPTTHLFLSDIGPSSDETLLGGN